MVRQSPWLTGLQSSFIIWTLLRSSFTGCNSELVILSSLKLLHCISCSLDGDLFLSRVQYRFSTLDYLILLVQGLGNGTSTKIYHCISLVRYITVYHCQTAQQNARKTPPILEKKKKKPDRCNLVTYSWCSASGLFSLLAVVGKVHAHIIAL